MERYPGIAAAAVVLIASAQLSCGSWTLMGCAHEGVTVAFQPAVSAPGTWHFVLEMPGDRQTCTVLFAPPALPASMFADDDPCNTMAIDILDQDGQLQVRGISVRGEPTFVKVDVFRDGRPAGSLTVHPTYKLLYPNGKGCGSCSDGGTHALTVDQ